MIRLRVSLLRQRDELDLVAPAIATATSLFCRAGCRVP